LQIRSITQHWCNFRCTRTSLEVVRIVLAIHKLFANTIEPVELTNMTCWYYDRRALLKTPSIQDGISYATECRYRREGARLIMNIGLKMDLGHRTAATGVVFFHRFYMFHSFKTFHRYVTACSCLFLAGKVEETPKKCKDIIKIAEELLDSKTFQNFGEDPKVQVMTMEKILLQTVKFDFRVRHPYPYIIRYAKRLKGNRRRLNRMVQMAWNFANDSLCTTISIQWEAEVIAIAVMYLAGKLTKFIVEGWNGQKPNQTKWWDVFVEDLKIDALEDIGHQVLDLYTTSTSKRRRSNSKSVKKSAEIKQPVNQKVDSPTTSFQQTRDVSSATSKIQKQIAASRIHEAEFPTVTSDTRIRDPRNQKQVSNPNNDSSQISINANGLVKSRSLLNVASDIPRNPEVVKSSTQPTPCLQDSLPCCNNSSASCDQSVGSQCSDNCCEGCVLGDVTCSYVSTKYSEGFDPSSCYECSLLNDECLNQTSDCRGKVNNNNENLGCPDSCKSSPLFNCKKVDNCCNASSLPLPVITSESDRSDKNCSSAKIDDGSANPDQQLTSIKKPENSDSNSPIKARFSRRRKRRWDEKRPDDSHRNNSNHLQPKRRKGSFSEGSNLRNNNGRKAHENDRSRDPRLRDPQNRNRFENSSMGHRNIDPLHFNSEHAMKFEEDMRKCNSGRNWRNGPIREDPRFGHSLYHRYPNVDFHRDIFRKPWVLHPNNWDNNFQGFNNPPEHYRNHPMWNNPREQNFLRRQHLRDYDNYFRRNGQRNREDLILLNI
ncbi:hypothetical protein QAD02_015424, partial [Eretmocerus hayati]